MVEPQIRERALPRFSIHRPVTVSMILFSILVIGAIAYSRIKVDLFPVGMNIPYLGVWVPYSDANPKEIEEQIVKPIEGQLKTVKGLKRVHSNSQTRGVWFELEFSKNTNMDVAYGQVSDRLERAKPDLPEEIEYIYIRRFREDDDPILYFGVKFPDNADDPAYVMEKFVQDPIERIKGVGNVELWGFRSKYIQIILDNDKIRTYKINLSDMVRKLQQDNFAISSGYIYSGGKRFLLRSDSRFQSLDDISRIELKKGIYLHHIARVIYAPDEEVTNLWRIDGKIAAGVGVFKESEANTVEVARQIGLVLQEQFSQRPELKNYSYSIFWDQGGIIQGSINNVMLSGMWGGLFAFTILFIFLKRFWITSIITLAITLSLLITLLVMYFIGWTLNLITMMGMMISIGMVVDNAIVITENIYRLNGSGFPIKKSAIWGASEVGLAITLSTLTTIVVFLPMMLMSGDSEMSFLLVRIGLPVIIALLSSLTIALVLIPLSTTVIPQPHNTISHPMINLIIDRYQWLLGKILYHRSDVLIIILIMMISQIIPFKNMRKSDSASGGSRDAQLIVRFPSHYSLEQVDSTLAELVKHVMQRDSIYQIEHTTARAFGFRGRIEIYMKPDPETQWYHTLLRKVKRLLRIPIKPRLTREQLTADIKQHLPVYPGLTIATSWRDAHSSGQEALNYTLRGYDSNGLADIADELSSQIRLLDDVISVDNDTETGNDEIQVRFDRTKSYAVGISPNYASTYLSFYLRGRKLSNFKTSDKEIAIYLRTEISQRRSIAQLKNIFLKTEKDRETTLASIADLTFHKSQGNIRRENGKSFMDISVFADEKNMEKVSRQIDAIMKNYHFPTGYSYDKGDRFRRQEEQDSDRNFALIMSIAFVFIIMGILFESFILPLTVLIAIPAAFTGAFWSLYLTDTTFEIMAGIGLVVLVGVVVNNAIVLIDMINQFRISGMSRDEAIIEAGRHRFRPIIMTAMTTICGLIPMAVGNTSLVGIPYSPMGITMIGGLLISTLLT
nr:efflux RND transporter permease subunit [Candidatus Delongbacteria bacterium]